ncbi:unnamed protein product [Pleuronectes platessa]|uniref:Uncharacterized protein n=1 Tax=Pleuronectes platessa TaxID=8262 RepID=A0A9N7UYA4_PLEPL|nr:unnamed protein product [Pleuronectes platessa]
MNCAAIIRDDTASLTSTAQRHKMADCSVHSAENQGKRLASPPHAPPRLSKGQPLSPGMKQVDTLVAPGHEAEAPPPCRHESDEEHEGDREQICFSSTGAAAPTASVWRLFVGFDIPEELTAPDKLPGLHVWNWSTVGEFEWDPPLLLLLFE